MALDVTKVDADRQLSPGPPAGNFRDEVMRRLLHGKQSLRQETSLRGLRRCDNDPFTPPGSLESLCFAELFL